jgi:phospholipase/carboxylesterase
MIAGQSRRRFIGGVTVAGFAAACASGEANVMTHSDGRLAARPAPPLQLGARSGLFDLDGLRAAAFVPPGLDRATPAPLLLLLHGAGGKGDGLMRRFMPLAEQRGVILLAPDSARQTWDAIRAFGGATHDTFGEDAAAIDRVLAALFAEVNIDRNRVAIGGFSDGASYAISLGGRNGDLFGDILAFSPGGVVPFTTRAQPRIFISHGRRDEILKFENTAMGIAPGLTAMGLDVTFHPFEGSHELRNQEMQAGLDWWLEG